MALKGYRPSAVFWSVVTTDLMCGHIKFCKVLQGSSGFRHESGKSVKRVIIMYQGEIFIWSTLT